MVPPCASPLPISRCGTVPSFPNRVITAWDKGGVGTETLRPDDNTHTWFYNSVITERHKQEYAESHDGMKQQTQTLCGLQHRVIPFDSELWEKLTTRASHHSFTEKRERWRETRKRGWNTSQRVTNKRKRRVKRQSQRERDKKETRGEWNRMGFYRASGQPWVRCRFACQGFFLTSEPLVASNSHSDFDGTGFSLKFRDEGL